MRIGRRTFSTAAIGWTLVGAIVVGIASLAVGASLGSALYGMPVAIAFALALLHAAAIPFALLRPIVAGVASVVAVPLLAIGGMSAAHAPWPWAVSTIVTQAIVVLLIAVQARLRVGLAVWLLNALGTMVVWFVFPRDPDASAVNIIVAVSVVAAALVLGMVLREWRSIRDQLVRARALSAEEHERRMLAEEKTRIARELHDVVAHNMSIINVRASTAAYRHAGVPAPVVEEFDDIAAEARRAMEELRRLLGVLRADDAAQELAPQPTLAEIPELVRGIQETGVDVALTWQVERVDASDLASLAAYRIVQEALSNALRHAPGAAIVVRCVRRGDVLEVSVVNTRPPLPSESNDASGPGHGLVGMRERAAGVGGTLDAGPTDDGGYAVRATVPLLAAGEAT